MSKFWGILLTVSSFILFFLGNGWEILTYTPILLLFIFLFQITVGVLLNNRKANSFLFNMFSLELFISALITRSAIAAHFTDSSSYGYWPIFTLRSLGFLAKDTNVDYPASNIPSLLSLFSLIILFASVFIILRLLPNQQEAANKKMGLFIGAQLLLVLMHVIVIIPTLLIM